MRKSRLTAATVAAAALAFGLTACGSDDSSTDSTAAGSTTTTSDKDDAGTDTAAQGSGGDYCTAGREAFGDFDPTAMSAGDPAAVQDLAESFRTVGKSAEGEVAEAWNGFADYLDLTAEAISDPSKATELAGAAQDVSDWSTTISESLTACS